MSITALIPCYNAERYLAEAIDSVLRQSRPVDEIIVVDDCSTDASREIAGRYPVRLLKTAANSGHATARNLGIDAAQGDVIAWLDADDYWEPNHIEVVGGLLDKWPEAAAAFSAVQCFGARDDIWRQRETGGEPQDVFWDCFTATFIPAMSVVTRTSALRHVGRFDSSIRVAPDFDLWLRMARKSKFSWTTEVTANYRWHDRQISAQPIRQFHSMYAARYKLLQELKSRGDTALTSQVEARIQSIWGEDLLAAWRGNDRAKLRSFLSFSCFVPQETELSRRIARRLWIPLWPSPFWDFARNLARPVEKLSQAATQHSK